MIASFMRLFRPLTQAHDLGPHSEGSPYSIDSGMQLAVVSPIGSHREALTGISRYADAFRYYVSPQGRSSIPPQRVLGHERSRNLRRPDAASVAAATVSAAAAASGDPRATHDGAVGGTSGLHGAGSLVALAPFPVAPRDEEHGRAVQDGGGGDGGTDTDAGAQDGLIVVVREGRTVTGDARLARALIVRQVRVLGIRRLAGEREEVGLDQGHERIHGWVRVIVQLGHRRVDGNLQLVHHVRANPKLTQRGKVVQISSGV